MRCTVNRVSFALVLNLIVLHSRLLRAREEVRPRLLTRSQTRWTVDSSG